MGAEVEDRLESGATEGDSPVQRKATIPREDPEYDGTGEIPSEVASTIWQG